MGERTSWDEEVDVIVVGFGGAGAAAALEAKVHGVEVLVLERFDGGGATRRSGGVVYAGAGTSVQRSLGVEDDAERMIRYLRRETGGKVDETHLRAFCDASLENMRWLEEHGVDFPGTLFEHKAVQPPNGHALYYSGNEKQYADVDQPAARGHVCAGKEMAGHILFAALRRSIERLGVEVREHSPVVHLVADDQGRVVGVEARALNRSERLVHNALFDLAFAARSATSLLSRFERNAGQPRRIRARGGVVLAAGGYIYNAAMVKRHAPAYADCIPLGTPADDGSGIALGLEVGALQADMNCCAATRFHCPPLAMAQGILVNLRGERFCDESLYGATVSREIARQPEGRAYLVIDAGIAERTREELDREPRLHQLPLRDLLTGRAFSTLYRKMTAAVNLRLNCRRAQSLASLAQATDVSPSGLISTVDEYNRRMRDGEVDAFGKPATYRSLLTTAPFRAIDFRLGNRLFFSPCFTLGGLRTDGTTARVLRADNSIVPGLYAAGRNAVGVCVSSYVSGLSIADGIFAGRNAGRGAAREASACRRGDV